MSGVDYDSVNISLTFTDASSTQCANITVIMDDLEEPTETLSVSLSTDDPAVTLGLDTAAVELLDSNSVLRNNITAWLNSALSCSPNHLSGAVCLLCE